MASATSSPQLDQNDETFTLHYFGLKGAGALATILLEQKDVPYEAKAYSFDTWPGFKPKCPTGLLPVIEYKDGVMIPESGAISRVAACRAGLLGTGRDFAISEMLMGLNSDLWDNVKGNVPTIMTVSNWSAEKTAKWNDEFKGKVKMQLGKYGTFLKGGDKFTSNGCCMGEMELWLRLFMLINGAYPDVLTDVSSLKPFYDRMSAEKGPSKLVNHQTKFGQLPDYFCPFP